MTKRMRKGTVSLTTACVAAACLALVGCGGGAACGEDAAPIQIAEYDQQCLPHAVLADGSVLTH